MTTRIPIHCLGLSYHTAPLSLREKLSYTSDSLITALEQGRENKHIQELVILSTCNRTELYACLTPDSNIGILCNFLSQTSGIPSTVFQSNLYHYTGTTAAHHLFRVATGLDSQVLGEPQILGQVTQGHEQAQQHKSGGPYLTALFRSAIRAGKRARTETTISRNALSTSSAAVRLAQQKVNLATSHVLIIGAGQMAQLAIKALVGYGVTKLTIANRSKTRAIDIAHRWQAQACGLNELSQQLTKADLVISVTGSPHLILTRKMVTEAKRPHEKPLYLIDLAVPRDIDPTINQLPNVHLFDIDDLHMRIDHALQQRKQAIPHVDKIITAELENLKTKWQQEKIRPLITDMRRQAESIRQKELARTLRHLPDVDETTRQHIEHLSLSLINKLLHQPTLRLRDQAGNGHAEPYSQALRYLFGLEEVTTP